MSFRTVTSVSIHPPGVGDLAILPNSIAVTCGEDGYVCFTDLNELKEIKSMRIVTDDGTIPSIAVSTSLASNDTSRDIFVATSDNFLLNRYSLGSKSTFEGCYLRCTEDIKHIDCSKSYVAVASEDLKSRVVVRANMERVLILEGHNEPVKSVAIDPLEMFVATSAADSTVKLFNIADVDGDTGEVSASSSITIHYHQGMSDEVLARIAWQPEKGAILALPQRMNTIGLYERNTWKLKGKLVFPSYSGVLNSDVNVIAFSPNGHYVAGASMAKQIFVWDVVTFECLCSYECEDSIIALSWLVDGNGFAVLLSSGVVGYASNVVSTRKQPPVTTGIEVPAPALPLPPQAQKENPIPASKTSDILATEDDADMEVNAIKRSFGFDPDMAVLPTIATIEDDDVHADIDAAMDAPLLSAASVPQIQVVNAQPSFQPGSVLQGPVILLAWNLLGDIEALTSADQTPLIVLRFNDKSKRGFKFHDTYNFTMADFDDNGAIFASSIQEDMPAVVSYRPIQSWTSNSAWHISLPEDEDILCVTTSGSTSAVGTSRNFIRVYSQGGVLLSIFALPGRIVTMASHEDGSLAVIYAIGAALHYVVYRVQPRAPRVQSICQGILPLKQIEWIGFNNTASLFVVEASTGTVFLLSDLVGNQWMPLVQPTHTHGSIFCVGVRDATVFFLPKILNQPLQLSRKHRPVLSTWAYDRVEEDSLWLAHKSAQGTSKSSEDSVSLQASADKAILLRIKAACTSDEIQKAYDLASCLSLEKSHSIAQQVAIHSGLRELHSRLLQLEEALFPRDTEEFEMPLLQPSRFTSRTPARTESNGEPREPAPSTTPARTEPNTSSQVPHRAKYFDNPFKKRPASGGEVGEKRPKVE